MLQQEIDNGGRRLESLESDITRMRNEKVQLMTSSTSAAREVEDMRASVSIASSERDSMKATIETLRKEVERLQSELHMRNRQLSDRAGSVAQDVRTESVAAGFPSTTLSSVGGGNEAEVRRMERELNSTREALSQSESMCAQLQVGLFCYSSCGVSTKLCMQTQIVILKSESGHKASEVEALRGQLATAQRELSLRNEEIASLHRSAASAGPVHPSSDSKSGHIGSLIAGQQVCIRTIGSTF
jgi:predicted RNase H-like nuclease (RuvC/YqgF family)